MQTIPPRPHAIWTRGVADDRVRFTSAIRGVADDAPSIKSGKFLPALRSVEFSSCYIYSPHGDSYGSAASRLLCMRLKSGDVAWLPVYARLVREQTIGHL